jgi:hypothetical protein
MNNEIFKNDYSIVTKTIIFTFLHYFFGVIVSILGAAIFFMLYLNHSSSQFEKTGQSDNVGIIVVPFLAMTVVFPLCLIISNIVVTSLLWWKKYVIKVSQLIFIFIMANLPIILIACFWIYFFISISLFSDEIIYGGIN